ncbi:MAG: class II fructose-bisphosphate aldolase, partial [Candidatus Woesearchaeota archaeon]
VRNGINKINIDTDLRLAFTAGIREYLEKNKSIFDPRDYLAAGRTEIQKVAEQKIKLFGCAGKAK